MRRGAPQLSCPVCRAAIERKPTLAHSLIELMEILDVTPAKSSPPGSSPASKRIFTGKPSSHLLQMPLSAASAVADLAATWADLFPHPSSRPRPQQGRPAPRAAGSLIYDVEDNVRRCPACCWEVEGDICERCAAASDWSELGGSQAAATHDSQNRSSHHSTVLSTEVDLGSGSASEVDSWDAAVENSPSGRFAVPARSTAETSTRQRKWHRAARVGSDLPSLINEYLVLKQKHTQRKMGAKTVPVRQEPIKRERHTREITWWSSPPRASRKLHPAPAEDRSG